MASLLRCDERGRAGREAPDLAAPRKSTAEAQEHDVVAALDPAGLAQSPQGDGIEAEEAFPVSAMSSTTRSGSTPSAKPQPVSDSH